MIYYAPAKINISLDILGKREDGYHTLSTIMQTISLFDEISIEKADKISISCDKSYIPVDERNLMWKAAELFFNYTNINQGCKIDIKKKIPVGAGMGGGSSDAAEVLIGLNDIYKTNLSTEELKSLALKIGADVPFFIIKGTCLAEGIGEELTPIENNINPYILIYKPKFSISTKWAYSNLNLENKNKYDINIIINALKNGDKKMLCENIFNVLEDVSTTKYPEINNIKSKLKTLGADASLMTGSGSAVFGLFYNKTKAETALKEFENKQVFLVNFY